MRLLQTGFLQMVGGEYLNCWGTSLISPWQSMHRKVPLTCDHKGGRNNHQTSFDIAAFIRVAATAPVIFTHVPECRISYQFRVDRVRPHHLTADPHQAADAHGRQLTDPASHTGRGVGFDILLELYISN